MSLHAPEVNKNELVACNSYSEALRTRNVKNSKSQYTQEHERSQTEHHQFHIRDVAEDPKLGTYSDQGF